MNDEQSEEELSPEEEYLEDQLKLINKFRSYSDSEIPIALKLHLDEIEADVLEAKKNRGIQESSR